MKEKAIELFVSSQVGLETGLHLLPIAETPISSLSVDVRNDRLIEPISKPVKFMKPSPLLPENCLREWEIVGEVSKEDKLPEPARVKGFFARH